MTSVLFLAGTICEITGTTGEPSLHLSRSCTWEYHMFCKHRSWDIIMQNSSQCLSKRVTSHHFPLPIWLIFCVQLIWADIMEESEVCCLWYCIWLSCSPLFSPRWEPSKLLAVLLLSLARGPELCNACFFYKQVYKTADDYSKLKYAVMMYSGIAFMTAAVILAAAEHIAMIVIGRVLQGIAISFASVSVPIYNSGTAWIAHC